MCDKIDIVMCRLCLNNGGELINIFDVNNKSEFMLKKTVEDLLNVKVVKDTRYAWLVCSNCVEKLTEFRLFKHRCVECLFVFHNRIRKGYNSATEDCITKGEECPGGIKNEYCDDAITNDGIDPRPVDVRDDMIVFKQEIDATGGCSVFPGMDIDSSIVPSTKEAGRHLSENEDSGNLDHSGDDEFIPSLNVDVVIKEECDVDIQNEEGGLGKEVLEGKDGAKGQDGAEKDGAGNMLHSCKICKQRFAQEDILKAHVLRVHVKKGRKLRTGVTSEANKDDGDFDGHVTSVVAREKKHKCEVCSREFSQKRNLTRHMMLHTGKRPYKCGVCSKDYLSQGDLNRHILTHTGERPYKCEICLKDYLSKRDLNRHNLVHTGERPHTCTLCSKTFQYKQHLDGHMLTHTGERPHKCDVCARAFTLKQQLKDHLRIHTGIKAHKCETCSKAFTFKQQLKDHLRIHTGEKPHKCQTCSRAFTLKQQLKKHMSVHLHTGEKPFVCEICSRAYIRKEDLKKHTLKHKCELCPNGCANVQCPGMRNLLDGNDRPFTCDVCLKSFRHKSFLKRHVVIHTRTMQHICNTCSMTFKDKKGLTRHMKRHSVNTKLKCSLCTFTSIHKRSLSRHLIEVHQNAKD